MSTAPRAGSVRAVLASAPSRAAARAAVGIGIIVAIVAQTGAEPFLRGVASISVPAVAAAVALTAVATAAAAWRWRVIAGRLGLSLGWAEALTAYYRSQFLNTVLPGGVVGDVHRAIAHGRGAGGLLQSSRVVAVERSVGQVVQLAIAAVVLIGLGMSAYAPAAVVMVLGVAAGCAAVAVAAAVSTRFRAAVRRELAILRIAMASGWAIVKVVAASVVVVAAHVATFVVACLAVGVDGSPARLAAVALIVVLAASIPFSIGGWGPREGAAAWAFAAVGLGAASGIAASTAFGVLAMIAVAPGAVVLAASALRGRHRPAVPTRQESSTS